MMKNWPKLSGRWLIMDRNEDITINIEVITAVWMSCRQQLREEGRHIYHQYVVRVPRREELMEELRKRQIPTLIHYPVPPHRQVCYEAYGDLSLPITERLAQEVLSLPISPVMTEGEVLVVSRAINDFYK